MRGLLLVLACGLFGCALERTLPPPTAGPLDSTIRASTGLSTGKIKFQGPVTFQIGGTGNVATTLTKPAAPVASAPHATATDASRKGGLPWWVFVGVGVASIVVWEWLTKNFTPMGWLPWRTK